MKTASKISARLSIRSFSETDFATVKPLMTDADTMRYTGFQVPQSDEQIRTHLKKWATICKDGQGVWVVIDRPQKSFVGWVMLRVIEGPDPELGFMLERTHWGKGFATELATAMLRYGFEELGLSRIVARVSPKNAPSIAVLEKIGMRQARTSSTEVLNYEILRPNP